MIRNTKNTERYMFACLLFKKLIRLNFDVNILPCATVPTKKNIMSYT